MKFKVTYLLLVLLSCSLFSNAQNFTASVNTANVSTTNNFQLNFTLNASGKNFTPPDFSAFHIRSGPSQSSQTSIVNGKYSKALIISYVLQPKKQGNFQIGSASIVSGEKTLLSKPITINVSKSAAQTDKNLFVRAIVNKTNVYQGEDLVVTFRLYHKINVSRILDMRAPALSGFWSEQIELNRQSQVGTEVYKGVKYNTYDIMKMVLFPQRNGNLEIDPFEAEFLANIPVNNQRRNDPFNIFLRNTQEVQLSSKTSAIRINVKPLPANAPKTFNGAVGRFSFDVNCSPLQIETNDAVNLNLKIKGKGNLTLIESPKVNLPSNLESYEPKVSNRVSKTAGGVSGTKSFEYIIIPRVPGKHIIDPITFTYFDLTKKSYVTLNSRPYTIDVSGEADAISQSGGVNKADVELLNDDIRFIKTGNILLTKANTQFIASPVFYLLMALPILFFGLVLGFKKKVDEYFADSTVNRSRKANKIAHKRLVAARKSLAANET
ncbi:MAG: protein BatD, partial [Bacteroidia bacterium]|nr:protein BatD [Bacteroidia bacterium]